MQSQRIDIVPFDLANEKLTDVKHMYIQLAEKFFLYAAKYYGQENVISDEDDKVKVWKDHQNDFLLKIKPELISGIELRWTSHKYWYIGIEFIGYAEVIKIYFQTKKEALPVFARIDEYFFGKSDV